MCGSRGEGRCWGGNFVWVDLFLLGGRSGTASGVLLDLVGDAYLFFLVLVSGSEGRVPFLFRTFLLRCAVCLGMYVSWAFVTQGLFVVRVVGVGRLGYCVEWDIDLEGKRYMRERGQKRGGWRGKEDSEAEALYSSC